MLPGLTGGSNRFRPRTANRELASSVPCHLDSDAGPGKGPPMRIDLGGHAALVAATDARRVVAEQLDIDSTGK